MPLFLVPTPIGNLGDITYRAIEVLRNADRILCEDTRTSGVLLKHYGIQKPMWPYHQHNEHAAVAGILSELEAGKTLALLTDAGTPGISDPGFLIVRECRRAGIAVECLPGATAFVPALVQSGLPCNEFVFGGFLPQKKGRQTALRGWAEQERTMVFYESPHRLVRTLADFSEHFSPERPASVSRELTKMFAETKTGTLEELRAYYEAHPPKGEIVIVVGGK
jgi:16S rRNA (cytidine1402-2'-O)-methyltransferase